MFLGVYRFEGDAAALLPAYRRMMEAIPPANLSLHACVERVGGIDVYDTCPTRAVFESFAASPGFLGLVRDAGLPAPTVIPIGEVCNAVVEGRPLR